MTRSHPGTLRPKQRRLILALIASIVIPVGSLLVILLVIENRREHASREITLYHMPAEILARHARVELGRLVRAVQVREDVSHAPPLESIEDAVYHLRKDLDQIFHLQKVHGSPEYVPVVDRIRLRWARVETKLDSSGKIDDGEDAASLAIGLDQFERLHRAESSREIASLDVILGLRFSGLIFGCLFTMGLSILLTWQIAGLMGKLAANVDERALDLAESEKRFRQLSDHIDAVFWITDADLNTALFVSSGYEKVWGRSIASALEDPKSWVDSILPEDRDELFKCLAGVAEGKTSVDEYRIQRPDGAVRWIRDRAFPVKDETGKVVRLAGVAADITEEKFALEEVARSESHLRSLMESARGFVVFRTINDDSSVAGKDLIFVSPSIRDVLGISTPGDFQSWFEHVHEDDAPRVLAARRRTAKDCVSFDEEFRSHHPLRDEWRWFRMIFQPVHDADAGVDYCNGILIDVTEERRSGEKLERAIQEIEQLKELTDAENVLLREEVRLGYLHRDILGESEAMRTVMLAAERVSGTDTTVLVQGETGTGKELVARAIHRMSERSDQPMLALNCAAVPVTLMESELFGRTRGAYTGATTSQMGRFEAANGGTIFLDEIGELPEPVQAKLLRVLEEGKFERLGSTKTIQVNVRIIAATNRDLAAMVRTGHFREDLFYRLNVFPITLPPLRLRPEDISTLTHHFVREFSGQMKRDIENISKQTLRQLENYSWPGNVRQLRNVIERSVIVSRGKTLRIKMPEESAGVPSEQRALVEVEKEHILAVVNAANWRIRGKGGAAELLGLPPSTLESRMKKLGIERPRRSIEGR